MTEDLLEIPAFLRRGTAESDAALARPLPELVRAATTKKVTKLAPTEREKHRIMVASDQAIKRQLFAAGFSGPVLKKMTAAKARAILEGIVKGEGTTREDMI